MMKSAILTVTLFLAFPFLLWSQNLPFSQAYQNHSSIPEGILEAVSWTQTRFNEMDNAQANGCLEMPQPYGVMGVFDNGASYFKENGEYIAQLSGISVAQQKSSVVLQIAAYAAAFETVYMDYNNYPESERVYQTLIELSQIPDLGRINWYARDAQVYEIMNFLNDEGFANAHGFTAKNYDLTEVFGVENLAVLSAERVVFTEAGIETTAGVSYLPQINGVRSPDYGPAEWAPAASCNYGTSRNGATVSAVTVHTVQGSYGSCISWFQNCNASVSAHYVVRSSDGQVTQCVLEDYRAWHVGTENNYTIGIEHEGWVADASWYTPAMYNSSAELVKDICNDYNINLKRVSYFPWSATTYYNSASIPGNCVKIKGHQHYPNQNHSDPGPNWNWDYYFKVINDNTTPTVYTAANGTLYDTGGASGNYGNDEREIWVIQPPEANSVTLSFSSFSTENTWDYLYIYDGDNVFSPPLGVYTGTDNPGTVTSTGGAITVEFRSECATNNSGWSATWTADIPSYDNTPPTTEVSIPGDWKTEDFEAHFIDADEEGGSGLAKSFYHVLYYNGSAWKANPNRGFFGDNFDGTALDPNWIIQTGTWGVSTENTLAQSNDAEENSNVYAPLTQNLSNRYMYTWQGKISGTDENRRAGLHFFCDDATQSNRGNSYLVYFRTGGNSDVNNNNKVQIYKVTDNVLTLEKNLDYPINANQMYNYKVVFDRITGEMIVIVDGNIAATWTDANPHNDGNSISFRSGNCTFDVDNFKVYRSRYPTVSITVGPGTNTDVPFQNPDPNTPSAKIKSIVMDSAHNISGIDHQFVNVDWTKPENLIINDGPSTDIDTIYSNLVEGNWGTATDPHSGIVEYKVAVGTSVGEDDVLAWTSNGNNTTFANTVSGLSYNQVYYISVSAENGAGLIDTAWSDGQRYVKELDITVEELQGIGMYPNPTVDKIKFNNVDKSAEILIYDMGGQLVLKTAIDSANNQIDVGSFASGSYSVWIKIDRQFIVRKLIKN